MLGTARNTRFRGWQDRDFIVAARNLPDNLHDVPAELRSDCSQDFKQSRRSIAVMRSRLGYSSDWIARSSWKRLAPLLLRREITNRTCPCHEVLA